MKDKNYQIYRVVRSMNEYFSTWDADNVALLTDNLKKTIYDRYIIKCFVFQRDSFKCKNDGCTHPQSELTLHHIKFQKNNGKDSVKNCATLCKVCHHSFHRGRNDLTFDGATYRMHKPDTVNWKIIKKQNRTLRKDLRAELRLNPIHISQELFEQLIRFLMINFEDYEDEDEDSEE